MLSNLTNNSLGAVVAVANRPVLALWVPLLQCRLSRCSVEEVVEIRKLEIAKMLS